MPLVTLNCASLAPTVCSAFTSDITPIKGNGNNKAIRRQLLRAQCVNAPQRGVAQWDNTRTRQNSMPERFHFTANHASRQFRGDEVFARPWGCRNVSIFVSCILEEQYNTLWWTSWAVKLPTPVPVVGMRAEVLRESIVLDAESPIKRPTHPNGVLPASSNPR
ncbi:hypothetical protein EDD15DRAFT_2197162 [Pisolithus albus]|nr:hypothetical protein EDD15DRAFT_2197162 [Pisolithus albus]